MKRFFLLLLVSLLLLCLAGCGDLASGPVSSAPSTTTTVKPTQSAHTLRLTVLTPYLTAKTDKQEDGSRYLISLEVTKYAPGTVLEIVYDGRIMQSYPAQIVTQSIRDTGELDKALTLLKGTVQSGGIDEGYLFQADAGGEPIAFENPVQGIPAGMHGTLCLYDYGDQDATFEGYFYEDEE